jgi:hypothetical protein
MCLEDTKRGPERRTSSGPLLPMVSLVAAYPYLRLPVVDGNVGVVPTGGVELRRVRVSGAQSRCIVRGS